MVEKKVVAIAILAEKKTKLTAMLLGAIDIPRELRITQELPGLAPGCKYSASTRLQVEELTKQQSNAFPQLVLADLKDHVMVEAERDLAEALVTAKRKLNTYVPESEFKQACLVFDQKYRGESQRTAKTNVNILTLYDVNSEQHLININ